MQRCMFCNRTGRIFNIFEDWNCKHTIKDDLIEIFGLRAEEYLLPDDVVCNKCMNILENFAKLKRRLWPMITDRNSHLCNVKPIKFGKLWDVFATCQIPDEPDTLMGCPSPSLLKYSHSKPYQAVKETKIAEREHARSLSRGSEVSLNREVSELLSKKRRRKRKGKKRLWTHRKSRSRSSVVRSRGAMSYNIISPALSSDSDHSYSHYYTPRSAPVHQLMDDDDVTMSSSRPNSILRYCDGKLINKRTRSVSRAQELEAQLMAENEQTIFQCEEDSCDEVFDHLDLYTAHKRIDHRAMALYVCTVGCRGQYLTKEDLELHKRLTHEHELLICSMCGLEIVGATAFQQHMAEHLIYSVPCLYCDKCFLDKKHKDEHVKEYHKGKKKRIKPKQHHIIDKIKKNESEDDTSERSISPLPYDKKHFFVGILTPPPPEENDDDDEDEIIHLDQEWLIEDPNSETNLSNRNSEVSICVQSDSAQSEVCDNMDDVEEISVTSPNIFEVPSEEVSRSGSGLSIEAPQQMSIATEPQESAVSEVSLNWGLVTTPSDLEGDLYRKIVDDMSRRTVKVVLVDYIKYMKDS